MGLTAKIHNDDQKQCGSQPSEEEEEEEDRISNLPSSVISYILSFLPTKDAVATSVLSSTWKDSWTLVTRLSFDDNFISRYQDEKSFQRMKAEFVDFVYRVLLSIESLSGIDTFRLRCNQKYDDSCVNTWLSSVLKKTRVQRFDVDVPVGSRAILPSNLFTCRTLVKLRLNRILISIPGLISLPCAKRVDMSYVEFPDDSSLTMLLNGCPVLDKLKLLRCMGKDVRVINISVPSLTSLSLKHLHHDSMREGFSGDLPKFHIVLDTPCLSKVFISDTVHDGYVFENLHHLKRANIFICYPLRRHIYSFAPFEDIHRSAVSDLLQGISKVQKLDFYARDTDHRRELPTFENLKELVYRGRWNVTYKMLHKFLERSPQLSFLSADCSEARNLDRSSLDWDWLRSSVPNCLLFHLKTVEITNFEGMKEEVELVEYFLKEARVLEKLTIKRRCSHKCRQVVELLESLPRASRVCRMEVL